MNGFFVTGTDTEVGKTVASAWLMCALRAAGKRPCYWKPVQTGIEQDNDTETVRKLAQCKAKEIHDHGIRLERPFSPHLSARLAETRISVEEIMPYGPLLSDRFIVAEGAGGVLVPLNEDEMMIDLIKRLRMPAVVVARSGLGTINHTTLTLEALRNRGIEIAGVIISGEPNPENRKAIEFYGKVNVIVKLPKFTEMNRVVFESIEPEVAL